MNKKGSFAVMLIIIIFVTISFIALAPGIYPLIQQTKLGMSCHTNYIDEPMCFIMDLTLPAIATVLLSLLIGFIAKRMRR